MTIKPTTLQFTARERNVFFHLLTACNLSCRHCYINTNQHGSQSVSRETMERWLALFYQPDKESNIIFLGGEPSLHPDLAHGIHHAKKLGYATITVDSNGFLFHDLLNRISPSDAVLSFSLDGPDPAVNDALRGQGVFAVCTENLKKAIALGFDVSVIYTVSRVNLAHLQRMPALLAALGVRRFFIQVIGIRGKSAASSEPLQLTPDQWLSVIPPVARAAAEQGIQVIYPKVFLEQGEEFACAGKVAENFFIFPNGRVYKCPLCEDFPVHALEIRDNQLVATGGLNEDRFFQLDIAEGCVMNKLLQPANIEYQADGSPKHRISCCLLKQQMKR
jgi:MoaA/NifB/PqqE/SkfB family radical SAM enzyme